MNKTILVLIGLLAALLTAAGIMHFTPSMSKNISNHYNKKGRSYFHKGDYDKAIIEFNKAIKWGYNNDKYVYGNLGNAYRAKKEYDKAIDCFNKGIKSEPKMASNYINRAFTYFEMGQYDKAAADFTKVEEIYPSYFNQPEMLTPGQAYLNIGNYDKAIEYFTEVINCSDEYSCSRSNAKYYRGLTYAKKDERKKAIKDLKAVFGPSSLYDKEAEDALYLLGVPDKEIEEAKQAKENHSEIKSLIQKLAEIDNPGYGYCATMGGSIFSPISTSAQSDAMLLTNHGLASSEALEKLVQIGPKALPFLLEALNDDTPTKLTIKHDGIFGIMRFSHEIMKNPNNPNEIAIPDSDPKTNREMLRYSLPGERLKKYTAKIGDICFVAIGQITNRPYQAVRYQPTMCYIINSPVQDAKLAEEVRSIWGKDDYSAKLFDSLVLDLDLRGEGTDGYQCGAAMRLLYYFPEKGVPLVKERLHNLDVTTSDYSARREKNGIRSEMLIEAVSWTQDKQIQEELSTLALKEYKNK